jgi:hypothetical protein
MMAVPLCIDAKNNREQVVSINTSKRLKELCALVFDSVTPHTELLKLGELYSSVLFPVTLTAASGIEIPEGDQGKIDQALAWLFASCA